MISSWVALVVAASHQHTMLKNQAEDLLARGDMVALRASRRVSTWTPALASLYSTRSLESVPFSVPGIG